MVWRTLRGGSEAWVSRIWMWRWQVGIRVVATARLKFRNVMEQKAVFSAERGPCSHPPMLIAVILSFRWGCRGGNPIKLFFLFSWQQQFTAYFPPCIFLWDTVEVPTVMCRGHPVTESPSPLFISLYRCFRTRFVGTIGVFLYCFSFTD